VNPSTPARDLRADAKNDPTGRHGDVDRNGDLVDEQLTERQRAELRDRITRARLEMAREPAPKPSAVAPPRRPSRPRPGPPPAPGLTPPAPAATSSPSVAAEHPRRRDPLETALDLRRHMPDESPIDLDLHARAIAAVVERRRSWTVRP
jgi:hypothetical protein